jgi:hypothetical protein
MDVPKRKSTNDDELSEKLRKFSNMIKESDPQKSPTKYKRRDSLELGDLKTSRVIDRALLLTVPKGLEAIKEDKNATVVNATAAKTPKSSELTMKEKTQNLTKHYEQDKEEDSDPFFEIFSCNRMTFLGK